MKQKDMYLLSSAIAAGLLAVTTRNSNPVFSNLALFASGMSAYFAHPPRNAHAHERMEDKIREILEKKQKEQDEKKK